MSEIIMWDDPRAAHPCLQQGWHSRDGYFYTDEQSARYSGCTHRPCEECGEPTPKSYIRCESCREKLAIDRYLARPEAEWDGKQMLYSEQRDEYYSSPDEAEDELEEGEGIESLWLVLCDPQYPAYLDTDYFENELPEDCEPPGQLLDAIDAFNKAVEGMVLSWYPGKKRLKVEGET